MTRLFTIREAAARMSMGVQTVYRLVWAGELQRTNVARPGAKRPSWRISDTAIETFTAKRTKGKP